MGMARVLIVCGAYGCEAAGKSSPRAQQAQNVAQRQTQVHPSLDQYWVTRLGHEQHRCETRSAAGTAVDPTLCTLGVDSTVRWWQRCRGPGLPRMAAELMSVLWVSVQ